MTKVKPYQKKLMEMYVYQCKECGRISRYMFFLHAPTKNWKGEACDGKVRRIKFKNVW
ncbi:hypothetical protein LCGC14_2877700 [marine sediment metagenome]|uniref:Uncharacterized protein n=1 Tax=marine sediment metagenome TaxID=412755 RepID=A0A0F9A952_9ZZZZ